MIIWLNILDVFQYGVVLVLVLISLCVGGIFSFMFKDQVSKEDNL